jgi:hypothetical protein
MTVGRAARVAFALVLLVGCKKKPAPEAEDAAVVVIAPLPTVPPIAPIPAVPDATGSAGSDAAPRDSGAKPKGVSALEKATEAAAEGRSAEVQRLLEHKVRAGHGSPDEVRLVREACRVPADKACIADIKAKYP